MNSLHKRILAISADKKLSHLGSNLTAVNIIDEIYKNKESNDSFILSSGHAGLALYVVLEKYFNINAEMLLEKHGIHPCKDLKNRIEC
jgi:transketolase N-terminal domain/subunit